MHQDETGEKQMYIDEFAAERIRSNEAAVRRAERPAQTISRHWHTDARRARKTRVAPAWFRLFRAQ
ncbi:MAG TPA: hypothetical protein VN133_03550 [Humibacter sp.]|nr:hypothetical protein [Humibacter sp.]